jgi:hypothetical protein
MGSGAQRRGQGQSRHMCGPREETGLHPYLG